MCPHCRQRGFLILHGYLYGYSEMGMSRIKRGHRIFCSDRNNKNGCGRTFSMLISGFIKNFVISAKTLWRFLDKIKDGMSPAGAFRASDSDMGTTAVYRVINRFKTSLSRIRTYLTRIKDPPKINHSKDPAILTIFHLKSVFEKSSCPVTQFQHHFQTSFL